MLVAAGIVSVFMDLIESTLSGALLTLCYATQGTPAMQ